MSAQPFPWSFSRLNDFEQCPKKFHGKYVSKEFPKENFDSPQLIEGRKVHRELELVLKQGDWELLDKKRKFLLPILQKLYSSQGLSVESQHAFTRNLKLTDWFANEAPVWVRLIWDVAAFSDAETVVVIDWKSGKVNPYYDQLKLFAGGIMAKYPQVQNVVAAYFWVDHPASKPTIEEYTRKEHFEAIWQEFGDRAEMINLCIESGNWKTIPSAYNCTYCPARDDQCPHRAKYRRN